MVKIIKNSSLGNVQVFSLITLFVVILSTIYSNLFYNIDYCATERLFDKKQDKSFFHHIHLFVSFGCVLLIAFQLIFWNPLKVNSKKRIGNKFLFNYKSVFLILHTFLWYGATYCICFLLKRTLDDKTCNRTHNSVSGHFLFHTFYFIAIPYWFLTVGRLHNKNIQEIENKQNDDEILENNNDDDNNDDSLSTSKSSPKLNKRNKKLNKSSPSSSSPLTRKVNNNKKNNNNIIINKNQIKPRNELLLVKRLFTENPTTILLVIPYIIYIYSSYINLEKTWIHGFHSIRQILYGLILSFLSLYILLFVTSKNNNLDKKSSCITLVITLGLLWALSLFLLNSYSIRLPFGLIENTLFSIGFLFLIYFSLKLPFGIFKNKNKKD